MRFQLVKHGSPFLLRSRGAPFVLPTIAARPRSLRCTLRVRVSRLHFVAGFRPQAPSGVPALRFALVTGVRPRLYGISSQQNRCGLTGVGRLFAWERRIRDHHVRLGPERTDWDTCGVALSLVRVIF
jgi:hypothetical protein